MATATIAAIFVYLALGLLVALPMAWRGIDRLDPAAARGSPGFRIVAIPGIMVLWPLVLARWSRGARP